MTITNKIDYLIDYVKDVKPYHVKINDISIEYKFEENLNLNITDNVINNQIFLSPYHNFLSPNYMLNNKKPYYVSYNNVPDYYRVNNDYPSWLRSKISDGYRTKYPYNISIDPCKMQSIILDKQSSIINDNFIPNAYLINRGINLKNHIMIKKDGKFLQEGLDYHYSLGSFSFKLRSSDNKWILYDHLKLKNDLEYRGLASSSIVENFYNNTDIYFDTTVSVFAVVKDISSIVIDEWIIQCIDDDQNIFEVHGIKTGTLGNITLNDYDEHIFNHSFLNFNIRRLEGCILSDGLNDTNDSDADFSYNRSSMILSPSTPIMIKPYASNVEKEQVFNIIQVSPVIIKSIKKNNIDNREICVFPNSISRKINKTDKIEIQINNISNGIAQYSVKRKSSSGSTLNVSYSTIETDKKGFKNEFIEFVFNNSYNPVLNDVFTIDFNNNVYNYLVHGSYSGEVNPGIIGEFYDNDVIAFKIPSLNIMSYVKPEEFTNFDKIQIDDVNTLDQLSNVFMEANISQLAVPSEYILKFTSNDSALVYNTVYGDLPGVKVNHQWNDGYISFKISNNIPYETGDIIHICLLPSKTNNTIGGYDLKTYELLKYDENLARKLNPIISPLKNISDLTNKNSILSHGFCYNTELYPLSNKREVIIFKNDVSNNQIEILKHYPDNAYVRIETNNIENGISLEDKQYLGNFSLNNSNNKDYDIKIELRSKYNENDIGYNIFCNKNNIVEGYLQSDPTYHVFTIFNNKKSIEYTSQFINDFLPENREFSLVAKPHNPTSISIKPKMSEFLLYGNTPLSLPIIKSLDFNIEPYSKNLAGYYENITRIEATIIGSNNTTYTINSNQFIMIPNISPGQNLYTADISNINFVENVSYSINLIGYDANNHSVSLSSSDIYTVLPISLSANFDMDTKTLNGTSSNCTAIYGQLFKDDILIDWRFANIQQDGFWDINLSDVQISTGSKYDFVLTYQNTTTLNTITLTDTIINILFSETFDNTIASYTMVNNIATNPVVVQGTNMVKGHFEVFNHSSGNMLMAISKISSTYETLYKNISRINVSRIKFKFMFNSVNTTDDACIFRLYKIVSGVRYEQFRFNPRREIYYDPAGRGIIYFNGSNSSIERSLSSGNYLNTFSDNVGYEVDIILTGANKGFTIHEKSSRMLRTSYVSSTNTLNLYNHLGVLTSSTNPPGGIYMDPIYVDQVAFYIDSGTATPTTYYDDIELS